MAMFNSKLLLYQGVLVAYTVNFQGNPCLRSHCKVVLQKPVD